MFILMGCLLGIIISTVFCIILNKSRAYDGEITYIETEEGTKTILRVYNINKAIKKKHIIIKIKTNA